MKHVTIALALLLTGCATTQQESVWVRHGATQADFDRDNGQCVAQAWGTTNPGGAQLLAVHYFCMQGKGWHQERQ